MKKAFNTLYLLHILIIQKGKWRSTRRKVYGKEVLVNSVKKYDMRITNTVPKQEPIIASGGAQIDKRKDKTNFIIPNKKDSVKNVTVINKVNVGSDNGMVGCETTLIFRASS